MKKRYLGLVLGSVVLFSACATTVKPTYISPTQYQAFNCTQLQSEYNRIQYYIDRGVQAPKRSGVGVGVGVSVGVGVGVGEGAAVFVVTASLVTSCD